LTGEKRIDKTKSQSYDLALPCNVMATGLQNLELQEGNSD